ncbi:MAG: fibronectin type III domain-containing protein [Ignavibacteriales bacterium]|nr:fibronectin type III domain-containing protein [Ignavibacteriales bacterium]
MSIFPVNKQMHHALKYFFFFAAMHAISPFSFSQSDGTNGAASAADIVIYDEDLQAPWFHIVNDAMVTFKSTEQVFDGTYAMKVTASSWGWVSMHYGPWNTQGFSPTPYENVVFAIYPTSAATSVAVFLENDKGESFPKIPRGTFTAQTWTLVSVPMSELNPNGRMINRIFIQEFSGSTKTLYIDNFRFAGAGPSDPTLASPKNGSTGTAGATSYHIQVSTNTAFQTTVVDQAAITATSASVSGLEFGTTYYWRVRGIDLRDSSAWSSVWSFGTQQQSLSAPTLISPADGATDQPTTVSFRWNSPTGSQFCRLQVSTSPSFSTTVFDDSSITGTSLQSGNLSPNTQYFWRVSARNDAGTSPWSTIWSFTTSKESLDIPVLLSPPNQSVDQPTTVTLYWAPVPTAQSYRVQISTSQSFTAQIIDDSLLSNTSKSVSGILSNTQYYWRVSARNSTGISDWTAPWSFTTAESATSPALALRTTIQFPENNYTEKDYKLVGLPGASNEPVTTFLHGIPSQDWEMYWDNGETENYLVPYNGRSEFIFSTGKAFWMIKRGNWIINADVAPPVLNDSAETEVPLHKGWNLITDPFLTPIAWSTVQSINATGEQIFVYDRGNFVLSDSIKPFTGYYFFNAESLNVLRIPSKNNPTSDVSVPKYGYTPSAGDWRINVILHSGSSIDNVLWFGSSHDALTDVDDYDFHKPRGFNSSPVTFFFRPAWDEAYPSFAADIRPAIKNIEQWNFTVRAAVGRAAEISFKGIENIPSQYESYLLCNGQGTYINLLSMQTYRFLPLHDTTTFTVIVGLTEEVKGILSEHPLARSVSLGINYPNPFNLSTAIPFELSDETSLRISIYNLLGQEVKRLFEGTLTTGRHTIHWDGTDTEGKILPSSVYFCKLVTDDTRTFIRRMILAK